MQAHRCTTHNNNIPIISKDPGVNSKVCFYMWKKRHRKKKDTEKKLYTGTQYKALLHWYAGNCANLQRAQSKINDQ